MSPGTNAELCPTKKSHFLHIFQTVSLPPTIIDQVRLWELERDRFKFNDGVLYSQFLSQSDFEKLRDYAKVLDLLLLKLIYEIFTQCTWITNSRIYNPLVF